MIKQILMKIFNMYVHTYVIELWLYNLNVIKLKKNSNFNPINDANVFCILLKLLWKENNFFCWVIIYFLMFLSHLINSKIICYYYIAKLSFIFFKNWNYFHVKCQIQWQKSYYSLRMGTKKKHPIIIWLWVNE